MFKYLFSGINLAVYTIQAYIAWIYNGAMRDFWKLRNYLVSNH